jgi:histidinol-phosphate aminotransferase
MDNLGLARIPSVANFVMFRPADARRVFEAMKGAGVRIRDVSGLPGCEGWLRVTVGQPEENDLFLNTLKNALG